MDTPEEFWRDAGIRSQPSSAEFLQWLDSATGRPIDGSSNTATAEPNRAAMVNPADENNYRIAPSASPSIDLPAAAVSGVQQNPARSMRTGVSGPSFLGLTDDPVSEDDLDEYSDTEPTSHFRRNIALGVTAAVLILTAVQWRSIRDYGLAYVQSGSMEVKRRDKQTPRNPPAVAADNTSRDLGIPSATAPKPGGPQSVEGSPNSNHALPVQQAEAPRESELRSRPEAMGSPANDVPESQAPVAVGHSAADKPKAPRTATLNSASNSASSVPAPGADEMSRAAKASDAEARAAWLWKAVSKGNKQAPVELAKMYEQGSGVIRSCAQAQLLLRAAAAKGSEEAKLNLRQIRLRGGCPY